MHLGAPSGLLLGLVTLCSCARRREETAQLPPRAPSASAAVLGDRSPPATPSPASSAAPPAALENDPALHPVVRRIAEAHTNFRRADGLWWAPFDCRAPPPEAAYLSKADEATAHGRKLYTLRILDFAGYAKATGSALAPSGGAPPLATHVEGVAQAVVKVSYHPSEERAFGGIVPVELSGKKYWPGQAGDLFVMFRPSFDPPRATDAGWLYATVAPSGETVTSAGLVASCRGCHEKAPHGRLFGLPPAR